MIGPPGGLSVPRPAITVRSLGVDPRQCLAGAQAALIAPSGVCLHKTHFPLFWPVTLTAALEDFSPLPTCPLGDRLHQIHWRSRATKRPSAERRWLWEPTAINNFTGLSLASRTTGFLPSRCRQHNGRSGRGRRSSDCVCRRGRSARQ